MFFLNLHGKFKYGVHRLPRLSLQFARAGVPLQNAETKFDMPLFIGLDLIAIEPSSLVITCCFAKFDKLLVLLQCQSFAGELRGANTLDRRRETGEQLEHGTVALGQRIESGKIDAHLFKVLFNQPVMLGFIAGLPR